MMPSGATQSSFRYLDLHAELSIDYNPASNPDVLWAHYSYDQPIYQNSNLHRIKHIVCVSEWQKEAFKKYLYIPESKLKVIRNGGADVFQYRGSPKSKTLIYTSTPFRGLEYITRIWNLVHEAHPDANLKVFSSMRLYGLQDDNHFQELFGQINKLPNAKHYYPVPHEELSEHLQDASYFFYPNTWEETSCVSLIEAMRSGCIPIITNIGALPETASGFGNIVTMTGHETSRGWVPDEHFIQQFADETIKLLDEHDANNKEYARISDFAIAHYDWSEIRKEWYDYITEIKMTEQSKQIQPVKFQEAITDSYIDRAKQFALKWVDRDRELCQTTSNFQIERFIAMHYDSISHAFENILRNRKAAAMNLFNKSVEMTERQREFDMRWQDTPKDQPVRWEFENGHKKWVWYDLDARHHEMYMVESEHSVRDLCLQLETYDKILEQLEIKNGGPVTRQQFNDEAPENWNRRLQTKIFDDMLSKYTGVSQNVFDSLRLALSDGIVPGLNGKADASALPSIDKAISNPMEFMNVLSSAVAFKNQMYSPEVPPLVPQHKNLEIEDWFNDDNDRRQ